MININKFISIRKKLGLSQTELCNGICTQSTLSKFENNGRIPSLKILNSLCDRLNINVADIMDADILIKKHLINYLKPILLSFSLIFQK